MEQRGDLHLCFFRSALYRKVSNRLHSTVFGGFAQRCIVRFPAGYTAPFPVALLGVYRKVSSRLHSIVSGGFARRCIVRFPAGYTAPFPVALLGVVS